MVSGGLKGGLKGERRMWTSTYDIAESDECSVDHFVVRVLENLRRINVRE